jgi:hypothetical protein
MSRDGGGYSGANDGAKEILSFDGGLERRRPFLRVLNDLFDCIGRNAVSLEVLPQRIQNLRIDNSSRTQASWVVGTTPIV